MWLDICYGRRALCPASADQPVPSATMTTLDPGSDGASRSLAALTLYG